jgi:hypothetical protein
VVEVAVGGATHNDPGEIASAGARRDVNALDANAEDRWLSRQELADRYGVPVKTPAEWASKGTGPATRNSANTSAMD